MLQTAARKELKTSGRTGLKPVIGSMDDLQVLAKQINVMLEPEMQVRLKEWQHRREFALIGDSGR